MIHHHRYFEGTLVETVEDHEDGTATVTTVATGATATVDWPLPAPEPEATLLEQLVAAVGMDAVVKAVAAGAGLADRAEDLEIALGAISGSNTARDAIEIVTDVALGAALGTEEP